MLSRAQVNIKMVQALTILSALQLFSEGVPGAEGSGEPYGISRGVVEGAARAGSVLNPQNTRELDLRPGVPALSQVSQESAPSHLDSNRPISSQGDAQKPEMPSCNRGQGVLRYERLSDVQLARSSSDTDIVRLSEIPSDVIFKCQDFCLKDRTSQSLPQLCGSFDFVPGKRFSSKIEYTESKCFLAMPEDTPGKLPQYKIAKDYYHYREVCYSGDGTDKPTVATDCPDRFYVMERVMGKRFMPKGAREVNANSLEECQQMCLNQATEDPLMATSICRAGTFDHRRARCYLSTYTRRTHPNEFIDDSIFDYFENSCLDVERRCPEGKLFWTKEVNAEMIGPYDTLLYQNLTVEECKTKCLSNANIYCRSIEYDERSKTCVLSDEDSVSRPEHIRQSLSDQNIYLELTCIDGYNMEPVNTISPSADQRDRQPLSDRNLRKVQTAFQLFRKRKLALSPGFKERGREGTKVSLAECLDACLEERSFVCRSAIYSQSQQLCRLSEFDRVNGNLVMDFDFDYFENLMSGSNPADSNFPGSRPFNFDSNSGRFRPINFDTDNRNTNNFVSGSRFDGSNNQFYDSGSGFSSGGGGFSSSGSRYDNSGSGFGSFSSSGAGGFGTSSDSRFGTADSDRLGGGNVGNSFVSREDRFSNAFNRFHEDNINRGSSGADTDRFGFGTTGNRVGGSGPFESSGAASGFGGTSGSFGSRGTGGTRVTGVDRFAGGTSGSVFGAGVQSSGADVGSLRGGGIGGGSRFSDNNRFSGNSFSNSRTSSFGFGPAFGSDSSSSFGASGFTNNFGTGSSQFGLGRPGFGGPGATNGIIDDNFQVSQQCNPDGSMEFMLRTVDAFRGRVYTFGYYDKCFYRGGGSTINVLKISPPRGFPDCGTSRYGDTTTNIVVVQFADGVMTSKDKRYNLTCTTVGPGDTVVTSAYIGAGIGAPIPIEYLPEESRLDSQVRLQILYSGRPTTTVAVGDPLTFRIESLAGRGFVSDIFATDVVARDLLTGRAIELIDGRGCPVQEEIFPALGKARSGDGLETRFSAFKIPESNMIVFEARVRMCRRECDPAICNVGRGRAEVYSYGKRRRRSAEGVGEEEFDPSKLIQGKNDANSTTEEVEEPPLPAQDLDKELPKDMFSEEEAKVNEVIRVYMNEDEAEEFRSVEAAELVSGVCISPSEYYSLIAGLMVCVLLLLASFFVMALCYRRHKKLAEKNAVADESNPRKHRSGFPGSHPRTVNQPARQVYFPSIDDKSQSNYDHDLNVRSSRENRFADPSEPIYTDPNLFERSPKDPTTSCTVKL
ncbi:UNVERIFIED_CONTAM: hypothetical protein RMT77_015496 [Armadillidium vulgare]